MGKVMMKMVNATYTMNKGCGKVKQYNEFGYLILEGEYLNGKKHGIIKVYLNDILQFEGEY